MENKVWELRAACPGRPTAGVQPEYGFSWPLPFPPLSPSDKLALPMKTEPG